MVERTVAGPCGEHQFTERNSNSMVYWCVGGDLVLATSDVPDEAMARSQDVGLIGTSWDHASVEAGL
jgi:hypothetical protein